MAADIEKEDEAILQATAGEQLEQTIVSDRVKFINAVSSELYHHQDWHRRRFSR